MQDCYNALLNPDVGQFSSSLLDFGVSLLCVSCLQVGNLVDIDEMADKRIVETLVVDIAS